MLRHVLFCLVMIGTICSTSLAQSLEPNPEAMKAFEEVLKAYRAHPSLTVKTTTAVTVKDGATEHKGKAVAAEFSFAMGEGQPRRAVIKQNGFTCWSADGKLFVVHESNPHSYYTMPDDDSAYYALMTCFVDLPFPDLALGLGNDAAPDVVMQLHPKAPWIQPTSVENITVEGAPARKIRLTSEIEAVDLIVDAKTLLPSSIEAKITGGGMVKDGAAVIYTHTFQYTVSEKPADDAEFRFDPGDRQRVDVIASLVKMKAPEPGDAPQGLEGPGEEQLVGRPAPGFVLATADGKAVDVEDFRGRVVVLDFWATWCPPCRAALPKLHELAAWAKEKQLPVTVLTINTFERAENPDAVLKSVREFWTGQKFTLPVALDYTGQTAGAYGVQGIPATFVIRSDGVIHAQHSGFGPDYVESLKAEITAAIAALEKQP